jgi:hypothetical protein
VCRALERHAVLIEEREELVGGRSSPIVSTLIDIGIPSPVVDTPAAMWAGGPQCW